ncbi:MAG TPA: nitrilase-related carbon-nitrogen hydrolase [Methylomirabilota bacterium]|nr:nitrilase-related carbon-nitrogen hydrolase [Methylomirabilota bacterium]
MIIGLASPRIAASLDDGLARVERLTAEAARQGAEIVCFPEAYLPGLRGQDFEVFAWAPGDEARVLETVARAAKRHAIAMILGLERLTEAGRQIAAGVFDAGGVMLGWQTKNQLDPSEEPFYVPGDTRRVFEVSGVKFGVAICHEGWRYPETVRWAAVRGAKIVFHPQLTGSDRAGVRLTEFGSAQAPYYEKAMLMRSLENTIYFASVNYALGFQESATCVIGPAGACQAFLPYGQEGVLVHDVKIEEATGLLAARYAPERHRDPASLPPRAETFWRRYLATLPAEHPHRGARPDAFAFGDSTALADELAALVQAGRKRATASLPVEFTSEGLPLPEAGDLSVVTRADGMPVAIIELTDVRTVAFDTVDAEFAAAEGEGDGTLAWWRDAHRRYFGRVCARTGGALDGTTPVICQRFRLVWR